jgi:surfactin synthase thioesterase subunit
VSDALLADAHMWATYEPLMRADFRLFDEYVYHRAGDAPFEFPITAFYAVADRKVTPAMVRDWLRFSRNAAACEVHAIQGHHLFVLATGDQRSAKEAWLTAIVDGLKRIPL